MPKGKGSSKGSPITKGTVPGTGGRIKVTGVPSGKKASVPSPAPEKRAGRMNNGTKV